MSDFTQTLFPDRRKVAGLRLEPLSIGHALLLQRLCSPFAFPCPEQLQQAQAGDMALALVILTRPWRKAERAVNKWTCKPRIWWHARRFVSPYEQSLAFFGLSSHILGAWKAPRVWIRDGSSSTQAPTEFLATLINLLITRLSFGEYAAYDLPLARAIGLATQVLHKDGILELITEADEALLTKARQLRAEAAGESHHFKPEPPP